jgi:hypothetical protein
MAAGRSRVRSMVTVVLLAALPTGAAAAPPAGGSSIALSAKAPEDYVVEAFRDHDIVFLGETHYIAQNLEFLQALLPRLHAAGVYNLGFEFTTSKEQAKVDRILSAPVYDEAAVNELLIDWNGIQWGFREYADVYRAAWKLNRSLPAGARPFRIVAVDVLRRITSPSQVRPGEKPSDRKVMNRILGGHFRDAINIAWANVITQEFIQKDEKALVYCGSGHSYTRFFRQRARDNALAAGNLIHNNIGERVFRIGMHASEGAEIGAAVEAALATASPAPARRIAFDVPGGPLAGIAATGVEGYLYGHPRHCGDFTLGDILDGYVMLAPMADLRPVTLIPSFVTPANLPLVQQRLMVTREGQTPPTIAEIDRLRREQLEKDFASLKMPVTPAP